MKTINLEQLSEEVVYELFSQLAYHSPQQVCSTSYPPLPSVGRIILLKDEETLKTYIQYLRARLSYDFISIDPLSIDHSRINGYSIWPYYNQKRNPVFSVRVADSAADSVCNLKLEPYSSFDNSIETDCSSESSTNIDVIFHVNFEHKTPQSLLHFLYLEPYSIHIMLTTDRLFCQSLDNSELPSLCLVEMTVLEATDNYSCSKELIDELLMNELNFRMFMYEKEK